MAYDTHNIFAKILTGEIACQKIYEDDHILAFHDIHPQAPIHAIAIPKKQYENCFEFYDQASMAEIQGYARGINHAVRLLGLNELGYRLVANTGRNGGQVIFHFHTHILGGPGLTLSHKLV